MSKRVTPLKKPAITLDQNASAPLYRQLYERLRDFILAGQLEAGTRLPSTRVLASSLGVSRTTTALAYEQLLLEGYIESRVGDGTRVACLQPEQLFQESRNAQDQDATDTSGTPPAVLARRGQLLIDMPYPEEFYANEASRGTSLFLVGQPDVTSFPYEIWARLVARHARQSLQAVSFYQHVQGYAPLRQAIATHIGMTRGVHCSPEHSPHLTIQPAIAPTRRFAVRLCECLPARAADGCTNAGAQDTLITGHQKGEREPLPHPKHARCRSTVPKP